jgi:hypothetical protein
MFDLLLLGNIFSSIIPSQMIHELLSLPNLGESVDFPVARREHTIRLLLNEIVLTGMDVPHEQHEIVVLALTPVSVEALTEDPNAPLEGWQAALADHLRAAGYDIPDEPVSLDPLRPSRKNALANWGAIHPEDFWGELDKYYFALGPMVLDTNRLQSLITWGYDSTEEAEAATAVAAHTILIPGELLYETCPVHRRVASLEPKVFDNDIYRYINGLLPANSQVESQHWSEIGIGSS